MRRYATGAHTKHRLVYHVVWIPKYRHRLLIGKVAVRLKQLLYEAATVHRWWIHELAVQRDHVHVLVQLDPATSVARAVQILKGGTSHQLRQEFPELEEWRWDAGLWADGYFAESIGVTRQEDIQRYIRRQA